MGDHGKILTFTIVQVMPNFETVRGGELGFLNCDDICMCVVNKQFELLEFVPFMLICSMMRFLSHLLLSMCACVVFVVL